MFNLAIGRKLRGGRDLVRIRVGDSAPRRQTVGRATIRQRKTGVQVRFELTEHTRESLAAYIAAYDRKPGEFPNRHTAAIRNAIGLYAHTPQRQRAYCRLPRLFRRFLL